MKCKNCKNLGYGYDEGTFFGWCEKTLDSPDEKTDRDCRFFQQKTNADRIRAMSDDELSELLISADFCEGCEYCDKVGICRYYEAHPDGVLADGCKQAARKWLQQPAEEE